MKVYTSEHDFDYSWEEVSAANWQKYCPWNKESQHVVAVDTLSRRVDPATGILRTERLITCKQSAPKWLSPFLGSSDLSHVYEISYVQPPAPSEDPAPPALEAPKPDDSTPSPTLHTSTKPRNPPKPPTQTPTQTPSVTMISQNMTWCDLLSVRETVVYRPCKIDPLHKTTFEQTASIRALCGGWAKVREKIEGFTVERFGQNAERGRVGFEEVLEMSRRVWGEERMREANRKAVA